MMQLLQAIGPIIGRRETDPRHCRLCCAAVGIACFVLGMLAGTVFPYM